MESVQEQLSTMFRLSGDLDDAFEFFGGTVNCKHLIAYNSADDDFDMDDGFSGKIQYAISVKDPKFTDNKGTTGDISNNFEVDNVNPANGFLMDPCSDNRTHFVKFYGDRTQ